MRLMPSAVSVELESAVAMMSVSRPSTSCSLKWMVSGQQRNHHHRGNRPDVLVSLMRPGRFDRRSLSMPLTSRVVSPFSKFARNKKLEVDLTLESIARRTPGFTGADLANLMNEAAILTARRRGRSGFRKSMMPSTASSLEWKVVLTMVAQRLIAYHEVGHALIGTLVGTMTSRNHLDRGQAQGLTWFSPDEEQTLVTRAQLKARIMGALGGRAAEDVVFGHQEVTTGAGGDIQQVASMADRWSHDSA